MSKNYNNDKKSDSVIKYNKPNIDYSATELLKLAKENNHIKLADPIIIKKETNNQKNR